MRPASPPELSAVELVDANAPLAALRADVAVLALDRSWRELAPTAELAGRLDASLAARLDDLVGDSPAMPTLSVPLGGGRGPDWAVCVGLRRELPAGLAHRLAGAQAAAALADARSLAVYEARGAGGRELGCALLEGVAIGRTRAAAAADAPTVQPTLQPGALPADVERALVLASAVNWCRALVDHPASELTPTRLTEIARNMAESHRLTHRVWSAKELREERFGGIEAVGRGAGAPASMIEIEIGAGSRPPLVLIGKGVTCDTGGLQIKIEDHEWLLADMAGAATVLAVAWAAAQLRLDAELRVLLPCVENMPGRSAYRFGDIVTHRDGSRTEVRHTDAEGRLVLADAIAYARERAPAAIVDVATLTDGFALGPGMWACLGNDDVLAQRLLAAGERAGDHGWRLPLWEGYRPVLRSTRADRANIGVLGAVGEAGTIIGGLFLEPFAGEVPWAHVDIAGSAFSTSPRPPLPSGATGSATAALFSLVETYATREGAA